MTTYRALCSKSNGIPREKIQDDPQFNSSDTRECVSMLGFPANVFGRRLYRRRSAESHSYFHREMDSVAAILSSSENHRRFRCNGMACQAGAANTIKCLTRISGNRVAKRWTAADRNAGPTSFSVAGFNGARPFTILVSNFQSLPDTRQIFSTGWKVSRSNQKKIAFATGTGGDFVRPDELKTISQIAHRLPPLDVQRKMATLNKTAAARAGPNGSVSKSCFSGHLRNNGTGELIPHDVNPGGEYLPAFVLNLVRVNELKAKVDANGNPLPRRLVQMALTRTGAVVAIAAELANIEGPPGFKGSPPQAPALHR